MNRNLIRIPTTNMSHEDWLKHRMESIGGSDAAGILGMNAYSSPYSVWADKTGRTAPKEDNEAMRLGRDLEDYVAKRFTEATGKKVRRENFILRNPDIPFAHANVDRLVIGEDAGLECKTTSVLNLKKFKNGEFPENYYVQCVHYLAVTGAKRWYLAVLVLGQGFYWFVIERDDAEIKALLQEEEAFWNLVTTDTPPFADGSKATTEALKEVYAISTEAIADLSSFNSDLRTYARLSAQIKVLEKDKDAIANRIKLYMKDAGSGIADGFSISFSSQSKSTFDHKAFSEEHPNMDLSKYYKHSSYRTFKVTERKK